jgi:hypothetical protein
MPLDYCGGRQPIEVVSHPGDGRAPGQPPSAAPSQPVAVLNPPRTESDVGFQGRISTSRGRGRPYNGVIARTGTFPTTWLPTHLTVRHRWMWLHLSRHSCLPGKHGSTGTYLLVQGFP